MIPQLVKVVDLFVDWSSLSAFSEEINENGVDAVSGAVLFVVAIEDVFELAVEEFLELVSVLNSVEPVIENSHALVSPEFEHDFFGIV